MLKKFALAVHCLEYKFLVWLLILFENVHSNIIHDHFYLENHRTEKQMSLESCLGRFDIHGNTIIRTGESQAIGGKFLQGLELETPENCERLCCETSDCDVYVFEEKNDGYCYLFQCGSPKNFHCKFTRHSNYTSALLTQFKAILTTTPRPNTDALVNISTQEQELLSLKAKSEKYLISSTIQTIVPGGNENVFKGTEPAESRNLSCGRFEFLCHSGECIAVYNACNGIPQCVDGSDEGPECSDATSNRDSINIHENTKSGIAYESPTYSRNFKNVENIQRQENLVLENKHSIDSKEINKEHFVIPTNDVGIISSIPSNNAKVKNVIDLKPSSGKLAQDPGEIYAQLPDARSSLSTHAIAGKAHVFNENSKWPTEQRQQSNIVGHDPSYSSIHQPPNNVENNHKHMVLENEEMLRVDSRLLNQDLPTKLIVRNNAGGKNSGCADYSEKRLDASKKDMTLKKEEISRPANSIKKTTKRPFVEQNKEMDQHLKIKFTDHDGHSEKPRGAVLSLILGLMVTGVFVILIGCRLRIVKRRKSRHGGKVSYAPDEDFLLNGMYL